MAFKRISDLVATAGALDGTELLELETAAGASKKCTAQDIADLSGSGGSVGVLAGINDQTGTSYTLVLGDIGKDIRCNNAADIALTIPPQADVDWPDAAFMFFSSPGTGVVTAGAGSGVTLNSYSGYSTSGRYDRRGLLRVAEDVWEVI